MTVPTLSCSISPAAPDAASTELLVLGPSLGTTASLWDSTVAELRSVGALSGLRILRFDLPGHGVTPAARQSFSVGELAEAVVNLVDELGGGRFHYAGDSLGGAIGLELAVAHPRRLLSLGLFCTDARIATPDAWAERAATVRGQGTSALVAGSAARWFAEGFIARDPEAASTALETLRHIDDESYAHCAEALADFDRRADLGDLDLPVLVVAGAHDVVTTPAHLQALAAAIPGAVFAEIPDAAHLVPLEQPAATAALLESLLVRDVPAATAPRQAVDMPAETRADQYAVGLAVRREVLGDAHVDAAATRVTPETEAFQEFITRYAWGEIWARPDLDRRQRSIATLASLVTGGHENEIAMHVRAALRNGLTRAQISEVILHTALYAGLPAANAGFAVARDTFAELDGAANES